MPACRHGLPASAFPPRPPSLRPLPEAVRRSAAAYAVCVAGASLREDYVEAIRRAGFTDIRIVSETPFPVDCLDTAPLPAFATEERALSQGKIASEAAGTAVSVSIAARKPPT